jgi:altronate dehydratase small subunit
MKSSQPSALVVNGRDNVATSLKTLKSGETVVLKVESSTVSVKLREGIISGHKFAIANIRRGEHVVKFGEVIGGATADIQIGEHVHVHNVTSLHGRVDDSGGSPQPDEARG